MTLAAALEIAIAFEFGGIECLCPVYVCFVLARDSQVLEKFKKFEAAKKKMEEAKSEWMESIGDRIDAHAEWENACEQHASIKSERMPR
jgi:hypothetical protein